MQKTKNKKKQWQQNFFRNSVNVVKIYITYAVCSGRIYTLIKYTCLCSLQQKNQLNEIPLTVTHSKCAFLFPVIL